MQVVFELAEEHIPLLIVLTPESLEEIQSPLNNTNTVSKGFEASLSIQAKLRRRTCTVLPTIMSRFYVSVVLVVFVI